MEQETPKTYSRLATYRAAVRPTGGFLSLIVLLVVPTAALFAGMLEAEPFKLFWASVSPIAGALVMYFYKSREIDKAGNGGQP